jgi:hypothetical protein
LQINVLESSFFLQSDRYGSLLPARIFIIGSVIVLRENFENIIFPVIASGETEGGPRF